MCGSENAVDDVEVSALEAVHHLSQQVWPFLRKVLSADYADGITQLHNRDPITQYQLHKYQQAEWHQQHQ